jgi:hypothetical protein
MDGTKRKDVVEAVRRESEDGRIPCRAALAIAARLGVSAGAVGQVCNEEKIKIVNCQLGCFGAGRPRAAR